MKKMDNIRYNNDNNMGNINENGCKFSYSQQLYEKPINVLISRNILRKISDDIFTLKN